MEKMATDKTNQKQGNRTQTHKANDLAKRPTQLNRAEIQNRDRQSPNRNARRDVSRPRTETKTTNGTVRAAKPKKPLKVIWQRLSAGRIDPKATKKPLPKNVKANNPSCSTRSRHEPAWREILTVKKSAKKMESGSKSATSSSSPTTVQIRMEQTTTQRFVETSHHTVTATKADKLGTNDVEVEPIEEFKDFFESLFTYLEARVPLKEREFLLTEREKFESFFERLKQYDTQPTSLVEGQIAPTASKITLDAKNSAELTKKRSTKPGEHSEIGTQTSFLSSLSESEDISLKKPEYSTSNFKVDKATQSSSKDVAMGVCSRFIDSKRQFGGKEAEIDNKTEVATKTKTHAERKYNELDDLETEEGPKRSNDDRLEALAQEIANLEALKKELLLNPSEDVLLKSIRTFYKRIKKQHKIRNPKSTQKTKNSESISTFNNEKLPNESSIMPEFQTFLPKLHSTAQKMSDKSIVISGVISKYTSTRPSERELQKSSKSFVRKPSNVEQEKPQCSKEAFTSQSNNLHVEIHTICNSLMDTKSDLALLKNEIEKETITIVEDEAVFEIGESMQLNRLVENSAHAPGCSQLPALPNLDIGEHTKNNKFTELSHLITDQLAKSTLEDIKQKLSDTEKLQQREIEHLLKEKPQIDENGLLHKLDSNMEQMQTTLIKLGKHYNYLPIEFLNQNYQAKWKSIETDKSTVLLESFKNCYPEKQIACRELDHRPPRQIEQFQEEFEEDLISNENSNSEIENSFENVNKPYA